MASFIMDQLLASACKLYHVHRKEVKDWLLFASNVAAHALALLQGGAAASPPLRASLRCWESRRSQTGEIKQPAGVYGVQK